MLSTEELLAIIAVAVAGLALLGVATLAVRLRALRRVYGRRPARGGANGAGGPAHDEFVRLQEAVERSVQSVGVVRFDAFEDMGGQLSFSAALLDGRGRGLVLTSINGRRETRIYAKPIEEGSSRYNLSDEEKEAIRRALGSGA